MMQSPALNQKEYERKIDAVLRCGANRGPHDYVPIAWLKAEDKETVSHFMCRVCLNYVALETIFKNFPKIEI